MHHPTDRIAHTTFFVIRVLEHWLEWEIAQLHHDRTLYHRVTSRWIKTILETKRCICFMSGPMLLFTILTCLYKITFYNPVLLIQLIVVNYSEVTRVIKNDVRDMPTGSMYKVALVHMQYEKTCTSGWHHRVWCKHSLSGVWNPSTTCWIYDSLAQINKTLEYVNGISSQGEIMNYCYHFGCILFQNSRLDMQIESCAK